MSIWLVMLLAEFAGGWLGYWLGFDRGMRKMENKRGRRIY